MKESAVKDDNILEIKNFKKVNGDIIKVQKKSKKSKKIKDEKAPEKGDQPDYSVNEMDFEEEFLLVMEENQLLHVELLKERTRRQTLEKLLNKFFKNQQEKPKKE